MNAKHRFSAPVVCCVLAVALPACRQAPSVSGEGGRAAVASELKPAMVADTAAEAGASVATLSPPPAGGDSPGKPQPPIDLSYELLGEPEIGQPLQIRLRSRATLDLAALNLALSGSERLLLAPGSALVELRSSLRGQPAERIITVTPMAAGTSYLDVVVHAEVGGELQYRSVTIPIRVGGGAVVNEPAGVLSEDGAGEAIITLPARD
jgi:hypothetical protein